MKTLKIGGALMLAILTAIALAFWLKLAFTPTPEQIETARLEKVCAELNRRAAEQAAVNKRDYDYALGSGNIGLLNIELAKTNRRIYELEMLNWEEHAVDPSKWSDELRCIKKAKSNAVTSK
jgi:hypothetical protein